MATVKTKRKKVKRPKEKQTFIKGTEPEMHKDIERAAAAYLNARDRHGELTEELTDLKGKLLAAMKKHQLSEYKLVEIEGQKVVLEHGDETAKVKRINPDAKGASL